MQLYNCKVRLGGSVTNEVRKSDVSAPEIMLLREMHGADAIGDLVKTRVDRRSSDEERERIGAAYLHPGKHNAETLKIKIAMMRALFGHDAAALPAKLPDDDNIPAKATIKRTVVAADSVLD